MESQDSVSKKENCGSSIPELRKSSSAANICRSTVEGIDNAMSTNFKVRGKIRYFLDYLLYQKGWRLKRPILQKKFRVKNLKRYIHSLPE